LNKVISFRKDAFTLIEITIALLILAVGLVGVLTLFPIGFKAAGRAGDLTVATFLAQQKLEEGKRLGYDGVDVGYDTANAKVSFGNPYSDYQYEVSVHDTEPPEPDLKQVDVTVYWSTDDSIALTTYIANYGP
jgi:prepilin-type N-terminal cleavage/methylation domain-containing protein